MAADDEDIVGPVIRKLARLGHLEEADRHALRALHTRIETHPAGHVLVQDGARALQCTMLLGGFAARHKETEAGSRQILGVQLSGDFLDLQHMLLGRSDCVVLALTPVTVARVAADELRGLCLARPQIAEALWRDTLIDASIAREWVVNVGRRTALARIAHLLCEIAARRQAAGFGSPERFDLPMTQEQVGDATGLTSVHVNRKLHQLEKMGVIARDRRDLHIRDWPQLEQIAEFDAAYLHQTG